MGSRRQAMKLRLMYAWSLQSAWEKSSCWFLPMGEHTKWTWAAF